MNGAFVTILIVIVLLLALAGFAYGLWKGQ
jgi:hypothetical protein